MMRSFYAGVSGVRNHQIRMDVIGNNIANVNTIGFKASRVTFADMLYQTMGSGSAPQGGLGGTNPRQVGLGVNVGSIDTIFTQGNPETTGRTTDLALDGEGFFVLSGANNERYVTRAGAFTLDEAGYLTSPSGYRLLGWNANINGVIDVNSQAGIIHIPKGVDMPPRATENLTFGGNLDSRALVGENRVTSIEVYDSQGDLHEVTIEFVKTGANSWDWNVTAFDGGAAPGGPFTGSLTFDANGALTAPVINPGITFTPVSGGSVADITIALDFSRVTQYANDSSANINFQDGYSRGSLTSIDIDPRGVINGLYSNGRRQQVAQVAVANFANAEGLTRVGQTMFMESNNSGELMIDQALVGGRGTIRSGYVEMSNVDLTQQFTDMIITQRGFQANSRVITTSDEMLQELVNLKR